MHRSIRLLLLPAMTLVLASQVFAAVPIPRGRPVISADKHSFVTESGALLRGAYWSTDWKGQLPPPDYLEQMKALGLNTLHLYGETFAAGLPAGMYQTSIDTIVKATREAGMYLVLTIGNWDKNGSFDLAFARDFWTLYAARYANENHVLFELHNEPVAWTAGYPPEAMAMEKELYTLVRRLAPQSPILLMSYSNFSTLEAALRDAKELSGFVDFRKAAIAFHGYGGAYSTELTLVALLDAGYPCFNTEFASDGFNDKPFSVDTNELGFCEKYGVSWLLFLTAGELDNPTRYADRLKVIGFGWKPDFGDFPGLHP